METSLTHKRPISEGWKTTEMQKFRPSMDGTLREKQKIQGSQLRFQTDFPFLQKGIPHSSRVPNSPRNQVAGNICHTVHNK